MRRLTLNQGPLYSPGIPAAKPNNHAFPLMLNWPQQVLDDLRSRVPLRSRILCAISGGPDSVALAYLLKSSPYEVILGHVDHLLRKSSSKDSRFVQTLAKRWALPVKIARVSVRSYAKNQKRGLEEAARE